MTTINAGIVVWDMDDVMVPKRGTTHLANGYNGDVNYFRQKFLTECGQEGNPLYPVKRGDLEKGFEIWERDYNNGSPITTIGQFAQCLTDMRHKLKVFPNEAQTMYTKNAILEGLPMSRIAEIAEQLPYNLGVREAINYLGMSDVRQILISNSNWALVDAVARKFLMDYNRGALPEVKAENEEYPRYYDPSDYKRDDVKLTGNLGKLNKTGPLISYLESQLGSDFQRVYAIDDGEVEMLLALRDRGANVFGYHNTNGDTKDKKLGDFEKYGIPIIETDLINFSQAVLTNSVSKS